MVRFEKQFVKPLSGKEATTRNGCSFCLTLASLPWTAGFGYVNLAAGAAVTIGFALLSEAIC